MTQDNAFTRTLFFLPAILLVLFAMFGGWLVDERRALSAATAAGFRDPTITDWHAFSPVLYGCDRNDAAMFAIRFINTDETTATATVCCGYIDQQCVVRP
jgi:hypothetical protein